VQPLAAVFMMNNLHYMVKTVESSEALTVLGEEWIEQHKDQARAQSCWPHERM
jgi:Exo70 exocyst complex subunit